MLNMLDLENLKLDRGSHGPNEGKACLMEAVSVKLGVAFGDHPEGTCPVLGAFGRALNDAMPDEWRAKLVPFVDLIAAAPTSPELRRRRAYIAADAACREFAPLALDAAGMGEEAARLRALAPVVDVETAAAAREAAVWAARAAATEPAARAAAATAAATAARATEATTAARATEATTAAEAWAAPAARAAAWELAVACFARMVEAS